MRGLGRVIFGTALLLSEKISKPLVISRPFSNVINKSGLKDKVKWNGALTSAKKFSDKNGTTFDDSELEVINYFHTSPTGIPGKQHLTGKVKDKHGQDTFWYQISVVDYWDVVHIQEHEVDVVANDYVRISHEMLNVGRANKDGTGIDTHWFNAKENKLLEWKHTEKVLPSHFKASFSDWAMIDVASFNSKKASKVPVLL